MSDYAWFGVIASAGVTTLALASYFVMAVPYFDNALYLNELRKDSRLAAFVGLGMFVVFFALYYLGALYLNQDNSGPLLAFAAVIVALPISMLIGSETWEHYDPKGMNHATGVRGVAVSTGIGLGMLGGAVLVFMLMYWVN